MSQLFEFIPLIGFFVSYKLYDIYTAVTVLMVIMTLLLVAQKIQKKPVSNMQLMSWILVLIFGGITLAFRNEMFLKWKPTVLNWGFGVAFLISHFTKKTLVERLLEAAKIEAQITTWKKLNFSWILFFFITGGLNLIIAYKFSTEFWVNFKVFGLFGLTFIFAIAQALYLKQTAQISKS